MLYPRIEELRSPTDCVYLTINSDKTNRWVFVDWVINTWVPNATGLKSFALVSAPESLADGSAANFYAQLTAFHAEVFDNLSTAREWLHRMQAQG